MPKRDTAPHLRESTGAVPPDMTPPPHPTTIPGDSADAVYVPPEHLQSTVTRGIGWTASSRLLREATRLVVGIVLARLLTPNEWGIAGMAFVVAGFLLIVAEPFISAALVQRHTITEKDRSTAFWMSFALGLSIAAFGVAFSGTLADFFGEPSVQGLFAALSVGFLISSLGSVPTALLGRDLAYRSLELRLIMGTFAGAAVAIPVAVAGGGPWAIVANSLAATTVSTALLWLRCPWRPKLMFSTASARDIGGFGISVLGSHFLLYVQTGADKVLVGRYLGSAALGNYAFAFNLMLTPILNVAYPMSGVLYPALATIQQDERRMVAAWLRAKRLAVAVMAPAFVTLLVVGPDLVPVVFGSQWDEAIPILQLLCLAGIAQSFNTFNGIFLLVLGRARRLLFVGLLLAATTAAAVGLTWGILAVAGAYVVAQFVLVFPDTWLTTRGSPCGFLQTLRATWASLPFVLGATGVGFGARWAVVELGLPAALRVLVVGAAMLASYIALIWVGSPTLRAEGTTALTKLRRRRAAA